MTAAVVDLVVEQGVDWTLEADYQDDVTDLTTSIAKLTVKRPYTNEVVFDLESPTEINLSESNRLVLTIPAETTRTIFYLPTSVFRRNRRRVTLLGDYDLVLQTQAGKVSRQMQGRMYMAVGVTQIL